ncbi:MAG: hypothetical protein ABW128_05895, partial [Rhizorhabdus sp.]
AFVPVVREEAKALLADSEVWHLPPTAPCSCSKFSGTALLAARLKDRVAVREMAAAAELPHIIEANCVPRRVKSSSRTVNVRHEPRRVGIGVGTQTVAGI